MTDDRLVEEKCRSIAVPQGELRIGRNICGEPLPDGEPHLCLEESCGCTERQVRYEDGEWSRTLEVDTSACAVHGGQSEPSDAEALRRVLLKLDRIPDSDAVTLDKADLRAALRAAGGVR